MYQCPGCKKRCSPDAGLLCPRCYNDAVEENAKTPSQTVAMPQSLFAEVALTLADYPATRQRRKK